MPYAIKSLSSKFPKLNLIISEGQSNDLIDKVKNGDLDMAILALPYKLQGLIPKKFWVEDFFWITKKDDARSKVKEIKANELDRSELLLLEEGHCLKDHILSACKMTKQTNNISFKAFFFKYIGTICKKRHGYYFDTKDGRKPVDGRKS
jgi:LysR family hydrogen peroxide-inducible transcriptional activator